MTTPAAPVRAGRGLDTLIFVGALLALACAAATWYTMSGGIQPAAASDTPTEALYALALDAQGAAAVL